MSLRRPARHTVIARPPNEIPLLSRSHTIQDKDLNDQLDAMEAQASKAPRCLAVQLEALFKQIQLTQGHSPAQFEQTHNLKQEEPHRPAELRDTIKEELRQVDGYLNTCSSIANEAEFSGRYGHR